VNRGGKVETARVSTYSTEILGEIAGELSLAETSVGILITLAKYRRKPE
jgi:hypothetical protein